MNKASLVLLVLGMLFSGKAFALGLDVGPVHMHGTKVVVGDTTDLKIVVDTIVVDPDSKAVTRLHAHRKGDTDDKFDIKVVTGDLDDKSRDLVKVLKTDIIYNMRLEKRDDNWKLLKVREDE